MHVEGIPSLRSIRLAATGRQCTTVPTESASQARQRSTVVGKLIPTVSRSSGENGRSFIFYQNEGALGRIIGQGCSTR